MTIELRAKLLTEQGSPKKLLIPPNTIKLCPVYYNDPPMFTQEMRFEIYTFHDLAKRGLFYIQTSPIKDYGNLSPLIYNGGWENQWIEHGELVVNVYAFRT